MKPLSLVRAAVLGALCTLVLAVPSPAQRASAEPPPPARRPCVTLPKPARTTITAGVRADMIVVKFQEGTHIRARAGRLVFDETALSADEQGRLRRGRLTAATVRRDLAAFAQFLRQDARLRLERVFSRPERVLDAEQQAGEQRSHAEFADLNLYYYVRVQAATARGTERLIDRLNALPSVEIAYPQPIAVPADINPPTPSYVANQGYLNAAPTGVDARHAWSVPGGRGDGVRLVDVEYAWQLDHEDLPPLFYTFAGAPPSTMPMSWRHHGTAVIGEISGVEDAHGITGIAPRTQLGVSSVYNNSGNPSVPDAINRAAGQVGPGDIVLLELQTGGPDSGETCNIGDCSQWELVPVEWEQANFDAIRAATARGVVVVEAGGNGGMNLDAAVYERRFDRTFRDSEAIIVGAGGSTDRAPHAFSNAGSRVDLQGWGDSVMTLGYGDETVAGATGDVRQWYTRGFAGTSSASPIVAGAAAATQGARRARAQPVLDPVSLRRLLRLSGTPQAESTRQIGPLPNLRAAIIGLADRYAESGGACNDASNEGWLRQPFCTLQRAIDRTPEGGTLGLVGGSVYGGARRFDKRMTITSVGGSARFGP